MCLCMCVCVRKSDEDERGRENERQWMGEICRERVGEREGNLPQKGNFIPSF